MRHLLHEAGEAVLRLDHQLGNLLLAARVADVTLRQLVFERVEVLLLLGHLLLQVSYQVDDALPHTASNSRKLAAESLNHQHRHTFAFYVMV